MYVACPPQILIPDRGLAYFIIPKEAGLLWGARTVSLELGSVRYPPMDGRPYLAQVAAGLSWGYQCGREFEFQRRQIQGVRTNWCSHENQCDSHEVRQRGGKQPKIYTAQGEMVTKNGPESGSARIMRKTLQLHQEQCSSLSLPQLIAPCLLWLSCLFVSVSVCTMEKD